MNSAENVSVKPCPFCGKPAVLKDYGGLPKLYRVECSDFRCAVFPTSLKGELADVVHAWNLRSSPTEDGDRVEVVGCVYEWRFRNSTDATWKTTTKLGADMSKIDPSVEVRAWRPLYASLRPETVGVSDAMVERLFSEMTRRMELPKHIHQESNPEWLPVDDTQVGVEFAVEFLTAALSPQEGE